MPMLSSNCQGPGTFWAQVRGNPSARQSEAREEGEGTGGWGGGGVEAATEKRPAANLLVDGTAVKAALDLLVLSE